MISRQRGRQERVAPACANPTMTGVEKSRMDMFSASSGEAVTGRKSLTAGYYGSLMGH
jgi:hypothetical protein